MGTRAKVLVAAGAAAFLLLLSAALLLPRLLNEPRVKARLEASLSAMAGGVVEYERADLRWLPRPVLQVRGARFDIPGTGSGVVPGIFAYPDPWGLLTGGGWISGLDLRQPDLSFVFPERKGPKEAASWDKAKEILRSLGPRLGDVDIRVAKGRLRVSGPGIPPLVFRDLEARGSASSRGYSVDLACGSDLWDRLSARATLSIPRLDGRGEATIEGVRTGNLLHILLKSKGTIVDTDPLELAAGVETEGLSTFRGRFRARLPAVRLTRAGRRLEIRDVRAEGEFLDDAVRSRVAATSLTSASPPLDLALQASRDAGTGEISLSARGRDLDASPVREAALSLAGDVEAVDDTFSILRGGRFREISFLSRAKTPEGLGDLRNLAVRGTIEGGSARILADRAILDIADVAGHLELANGVLRGTGLSGRMGRARARDGSLAVGLAGPSPPFRLEVRLDAELSELPPLLDRLVDDPAFRRENALVDRLEGRASGLLRLGNDLREVRAEVSVDRMEFSARYRRIPSPIEVRAGRFSFAGGAVSVSGLEGSVGRSRFEELSATVGIPPPHRVDVSARGLSLDAGELFALADSSPAGKAILPPGWQGIAGTMTFENADLGGPLFESALWSGEAQGEIVRLSLAHANLPGPFRAENGRISLQGRTLSVEGARVSLLDASGTVAATYSARTAESPPSVTFRGKGEIGEEAARWLWETAGAPTGLRVATPVSVASLSGSWKEGNRVDAKGEGTIAGEVRILFDAAGSPGEVDLRSLRVRHGESEAVIGYRRLDAEKSFGFSFHGLFRRETAARIFSGGHPPFERISGDLSGELDLDRLADLTLSGTLEAEGIDLPGIVGERLSVERIALEGRGREFRIRESSLSLGDLPVRLSGTVSATGSTWDLDLSASADSVSWDNLSRLAGTGREALRERNGTEAPAKEEDPGLPVRGTIRARVERLDVLDIRLEPVSAAIRLRKEGIGFELAETTLCSIAMTGSGRYGQGELAGDFRFRANDEEFGPTLSCLTGNREIISGRFDLEADLAVSGPPKNLLQSLSGSYRYEVRNGRIDRSPRFYKVLAFLNLSETFRGRLPDTRQGIPFNRFAGHGHLDRGILRIEEGVLDGRDLDTAWEGTYDLGRRSVDVVAVVAPFTTVDSVVRRIPVLGHILGGSLVTVPVRISGPLEDPEVSYHPVQQVGSGMLGILRRTVNYPIHLVEPVLPKREPKGEPGE